MNVDTPGIGETIRDARAKQEMTQQDLAEKAGVSRPTIARVERGNDINTATLTKISDVLGLTLELTEKK